MSSYHLAQVNAHSSRQWTLDELDVMHTNVGHTVVLTWPTEEGGRWMLGRHALTYQPGWLCVRQLREPFATPRSTRNLLRQMWTRQPRPLEIRYLRAYQHLPALRWYTARAERMALQSLDGHPVEAPVVRPGEMPPAFSPTYRHPHALRSAPVVPGCVVVVDLDVERGCPVYAFPPASASAGLTPVGHYRGGLTLLTVAVTGPAVFTVDAEGRYGWILAQILRHLDEAPGACGTPCPSQCPLLCL
jgi:hypothetical protein